MHHHYPCSHETENVPSKERVSDYHPLTLQEILAFLRLAVTIDTVQEISSIQVRLGQGIVGSVCPAEIEGSVAERQNEIDELYVGYIRNPGQYEDITLLAKRLYDLMQGKEELCF